MGTDKNKYERVRDRERKRQKERNYLLQMLPCGIPAGGARFKMKEEEKRNKK